MISVLAAGGLVYQKQADAFQVLLIHRNGVWDLPKGTKEKNESIEHCACREVAEEVGIPLPKIDFFLTQTYHEYERDGENFGKTTYWYRMQTDVQQKFTPQQEEGIDRVRWFEIHEARQKIKFKNLKVLFKIFEDSVK